MFLLLGLSFFLRMLDVLFEFDAMTALLRFSETLNHLISRKFSPLSSGKRARRVAEADSFWRNPSTEGLVDIGHGVRKQADPVAVRVRAGRFSAPEALLLQAGPTGMVGPVVEGLGVRHEPEDPAGGIADAGDVHQGAVRVEGPSAIGRPAVRAAVMQDDLVVFPEPFEILPNRVELAFAVAHRHFDGVDSPGEDAGGVRVDPEPDPGVDEVAPVIGDEGDPALMVIRIECGEETEVDERYNIGL